MKLHQHMTPAWAGRVLWETFFSDATSRDFATDPTAGDGRLLDAIPQHIPAMGFEIDPRLAQLARDRTGREVILGDFLTAVLPRHLTIVFGNPPFSSRFFEQMLKRLEAYDDGLRIGMILPAYFYQRPSTVLRWNRIWTIAAEIIPKNLFRPMEKPLIFSVLQKDPKPVLRGLRLFVECAEVEGLNPEAQESLRSRGSWRAVVAEALRDLGGRARLEQIYDRLKNRRPTGNSAWKEKIRQTLGRGAGVPLGDGLWELPQNYA